MKVDITKIYNQYLSNFDGRTVMGTTTFAKLDVFYIKFDILQLPHLLGLHKIYKVPPKEICRKLSSSEISYEIIQRNRNFLHIKDRISHFPFILDIFLEDYNDSIIYVAESDKRGNSMSLDIAFAHPYKNKYLTLGLREIALGVYAPVTFYTNKKEIKAPFPHSKRVKLDSFDFLNS